VSVVDHGPVRPEQQRRRKSEWLGRRFFFSLAPFRHGSAKLIGSSLGRPPGGTTMEPRQRAISFADLKKRSHSAGSRGDFSGSDGGDENDGAGAATLVKSEASNPPPLPPPPPQQKLGLLKRKLKAREQTQQRQLQQKKLTASVVKIQAWLRMLAVVRRPSGQRDMSAWPRAHEPLVAVVQGWRVRRLFQCTRVEALRQQVVESLMLQERMERRLNQERHSDDDTMLLQAMQRQLFSQREQLLSLFIPPLPATSQHETTPVSKYIAFNLILEIRRDVFRDAGSPTNHEYAGGAGAGPGQHHTTTSFHVAPPLRMSASLQRKASAKTSTLHVPPAAGPPPQENETTSANATEIRRIPTDAGGINNPPSVWIRVKVNRAEGLVSPCFVVRNESDLPNPFVKLELIRPRYGFPCLFHRSGCSSDMYYIPSPHCL
jgi:hypothetical protein